MKSGQRGAFRNRYPWAYDGHGMRFDGQLSTLAGATVLLGDSIVEGGLGLRQEETIAARLSAGSGELVYPVACPGWALANALGQFTGMAGWQEAKRLLLIVNTGDFDTVAVSGSEFSFPLRYPRWLALWLVRRHLYRHKPRWWPGKGDATPVRVVEAVRAENLARFSRVVTDFRGQIVIVRYPRRSEDPSTEPFFTSLQACDASIKLVDVGEATEWSDKCYIDEIHPNAFGVAWLAELLLERAF